MNLNARPGHQLNEQKNKKPGARAHSGTFQAGLGKQIGPATLA
jgi:hypothetical protein